LCRPPPSEDLRRDLIEAWPCALRDSCSPESVLSTDLGRELYEKRRRNVEPVFGQIKYNRGITPFPTTRQGRSAVRVAPRRSHPQSVEAPQSLDHGHWRLTPAPEGVPTERVLAEAPHQSQVCTTASSGSGHDPRSLRSSDAAPRPPEPFCTRDLSARSAATWCWRSGLPTACARSRSSNRPVSVATLHCTDEPARKRAPLDREGRVQSPARLAER
jgi:hypothetical protein